MKKHLSPSDCINSLIRDKRYKKDYAKLHKIPRNSLDFTLEMGRFLKKWNLKSPLLPAEKISQKGKERKDFLYVTGDFTVRLIPYEQDNGFHYRKNDRFLKIEIDLNKNIKAILDDVRLTVSYYKGISEERGRNTELEVDPWEVYDLRKEGLSLTKIAQQKANIFTNPSLDKILMAKYNQVKRAYEKATQMISIFKKDTRFSRPKTSKKIE